MSYGVSTTPSLQERITSRLHDSIGDLITEEDLKQIVDRGVEELLFKERTVPGRHGYTTETRPGLVHEILKEQLGEQVRGVVTQWLQDNPEKVQEAMDRAIANGVGAAVMRTLDSRFAEVFSQGVSMLQMQGLLPRQGGH